jgi:hypothetical protein
VLDGGGAHWPKRPCNIQLKIFKFEVQLKTTKFGLGAIEFSLWAASLARVPLLRSLCSAGLGGVAIPNATSMALLLLNNQQTAPMPMPHSSGTPWQSFERKRNPE